MKYSFSKRRATSFILSVFMVTTSVPMIAFGNESAGTSIRSTEILADTKKNDGAAYSALVLTPGSTQYDINLAWYSPLQAGNQSFVRIMKDGRMVKKQEGITQEVVGSYENAEAIANGVMLEGLVSHKVDITGLEADTTYTYQISNNGVDWSEAYIYETKAKGNFKFAVVGDPQIKEGQYNQSNPDMTLSESWQTTLQAIEEQEVNFIVSVGDHIEGKKIDGAYKTNESEYDGFFSAEQLANIPYAPTLGNHDINYGFKYHFNIPNEKDYTLIETFNNSEDQERLEMEAAGNYFYQYNGALFVMLNDAAYPCDSPDNYEAGIPVAEAYVKEFEKTLEAATTAYPDYKWLFVQHHKSTRTAAQHTCDYDIQAYVEAGFEKIMDAYDVDFVFGGHDHVYTRSHALNDGKIVDKGEDVLVNPEGTVYFTFTSCTGKEFYDIYSAKAKTNAHFPLLQDGTSGSENFKAGTLPYGINVAIQESKSQYSIVEVTEQAVTIETYNQDGTTPIDTFVVKKVASEDADTEESIQLNVPTEKVNEDIKFTDLNRYSWAQKAIDQLASVGIINERENDQFEPQLSVKRHDFIQMLTKAMGINQDKLNAESTLSRQQAMLILARALERVNLLGEADTTILNSFADAPQISTDAQKAISQLLALGIVKGDGTNLSPTREITRAEAAVLINGAYELFLAASLN